MPNTYPRPHIHPGNYSERGIDPKLLVVDSVAADTFQSPHRDLDSIFNATDIDGLISHDANMERSLGTYRHAGVQALDRHENTNPPYFSRRGVFSNEQKQIIEQFSAETPSSVLERLRAHDPSMQETYKQVKGGVENERRKKNRRQANGRWTKDELGVLRQNIDLAPRQLETMLRSAMPGSKKNVDQIRDMKEQLRKKTQEMGKAVVISEKT
jgi:hypothetical protein